jgi:transcriptional regulator with XRE-family HTH domain
MERQFADPLPGFAARLHALRQERGLSQEGLAAVAGLDRTYVSSCEAGRRNVTLRTIYRLAAALEVDPAELVSDRGEATSD